MILAFHCQYLLDDVHMLVVKKSLVNFHDFRSAHLLVLLKYLHRTIIDHPTQIRSRSKLSGKIKVWPLRRNTFAFYSDCSPPVSGGVRPFWRTSISTTIKGAGKVSGHQDSQHHCNGLYRGLASWLRRAARGPGHGRCGAKVPGQGDPSSQTHPGRQVLSRQILCQYLIISVKVCSLTQNVRDSNDWAT